MQQVIESRMDILLKLIILHYVLFLRFLSLVIIPRSFPALAEQKGCELWTADARLYKSVHDKFPWVHNLSEYSTRE